MSATTTSLSQAITASQTEFPVASLTGFFPRGSRGKLYCQIEDERCYVVGTSPGGNVLVVQRGADGTTAVAHAASAPISVSSTASDLPVAPYSEASGLFTTVGGVQTYAGTGDPTSTTGIGTAGPGSLYVRTDAPYRNLFENVGTAAAPSWQYLAGNQGPSMAWGTITSAQITATTAGNLGHAQGVVLVPAAASTDYQFLFPLACFLHYTYSTDAYGDGGNLSITYGSGGAAVTGTVSAANSIGAATNKYVVLLPVAPTANAIASGKSLNLVAASAFTNPGTAAGSIYYHVVYVKTG